MNTHTLPIDGLQVIPEFITPQEESLLISQIDSAPWGGNGIPPNPELRRRTQHYGYLFLYRTRNVEKFLGPLPKFSHFLLQRLKDTLGPLLEDSFPNSLIVNEYNASQGIMPHTDSLELFGSVVLSLSLLSPCIMEFTKEGKDPVKVLLEPRSLLVMSGSARTDWKHCISKELVEDLEGKVIMRTRRVSLTFRRILDVRRFHDVSDGMPSP